MAGLADATFLTVKHLTGESLACGESFGCSEVLGSKYASFRGIPLAAAGALAYFTAFSSATLAAAGYARARTVLALVVAGMFLMSLWLLYLQAFVLHAFCRYCLLSAAFSFALAGIVVALPFRPSRS
ncbi:MAG: vitamin K epoxide reductase family protein [Verrucomicrobiota bacterium]